VCAEAVWGMAAASKSADVSEGTKFCEIEQVRGNGCTVQVAANGLTMLCGGFEWSTVVVFEWRGRLGVRTGRPCVCVGFGSSIVDQSSR
jgi:hypothetical protein